MKRITICVRDDLVGTIVSLVAEYANELHVVAEGKPATRASPRNTERTLPEETRLGKLVLRSMPSDGTQVLRAAVQDELEKAGFARTSLSPILSQLLARKLVVKVGRDHLALAVGNA